MAVKQLKLNDSDQSREYQRHVAALEREISLYRKMRHRWANGLHSLRRRLRSPHFLATFRALVYRLIRPAIVDM